MLPARPVFLPENIARNQLSGNMAAMRAAEFHRLAVGTIPADPNLIQSTLPASKNKGYLHSYPLAALLVRYQLGPEH